jgi:predicted O-methyltransferase YrrM
LSAYRENHLEGTAVRSTRLRIAKTPVVGPGLLLGYRAKTALSYYRRPLGNLVRWLFESKEVVNFTYDLEPLNERYLAAAISNALDEPFSAVLGYLKEIGEDQALRNHVEGMTQKSEFALIADSHARFARRIGWHAVVRALKPGVVVETGVDKGLGSCVLAAALRKNANEGFAGRYFGIDINPRAGYLFAGAYADCGSIIYGDAIQTLEQFQEPIDLYISDSDHSSEYEYREYQTVHPKLSERAIILGDNCHASDALLRFSLETSRSFFYFQEHPARHWYPGAGIGFSFPRH